LHEIIPNAIGGSGGVGAFYGLKPVPQKTKKTVFPKTDEIFTEQLKTLTKLLLCVILQTVKDN